MSRTKKILTVAAVLIAAVYAAWFIIHRMTAYDGPSHFPKSQWASAGDRDPVSALESACWAAKNGDGKMFLAGITPELQHAAEQAWNRKGKDQGLTLEDYCATNCQAVLGYVLGFRVLDERMASDHEADVHVYIQGWWHKATIHMKKIDAEWKVAGVVWK